MISVRIGVTKNHPVFPYEMEEKFLFFMFFMIPQTKRKSSGSAPELL